MWRSEAGCGGVWRMWRNEVECGGVRRSVAECGECGECGEYGGVCIKITKTELVLS